MSKTRILFLLVFSFFAVASLTLPASPLSSYVVKDSLAYFNCTEIDIFDDFMWSPVASTSSNVRITSSVSTDQKILESYIFDGYSWLPVQSSRDPGMPEEYTIEYTRKYSEQKDFVVGAQWVYKNYDGSMSTCSLQEYLSIFKASHDNYGSLTLTYPSPSASLTISDGGKCIGAVISQTASPWSGNNYGAQASLWPHWLVNSPDRPKWFGPLPDPSTENGVWSRGRERVHLRWVSLYQVPITYPTSVTFTLERPEFSGVSPDQNPVGSYDFNNLLIYTRPQIDGSCARNSLTLPPLVRSTCPLVSSHEVGSAAKSLKNRWQSVAFTSPTSGYVDKVSVKIGNYGGAERRISCKVTDENGNIVSVIRKSKPFVGSADWREISFENETFKLEGGRKYFLKCKGPDRWASLYWIWDAALGLSTGKNYRIYLCSSSN